MRRWVLAGVFALLFGTLAGGTPAAADAVGTVSVEVRGLSTNGSEAGLTGASVTLENLTTGAQVGLNPLGSTSPFYASLNVPYGSYGIQVAHPDFITQYWPNSFSADAAQTVYVGDGPNCVETNPAPCPVHRLTIQLHEGVPLSGAVKFRDGRGASGLSVEAQRVDEPTYEPTTMSANDGNYSLLLPPGEYTLSVPGRTIATVAPVTLRNPVTQNLVLLTAPGKVGNVVAAAGDKRVSVTWTAPEDDGGSPVREYEVITSPGNLTCVTSLTGCTVDGLQNGQPYRVTIIARNALGPGEPAVAPNPVTPTAGKAGPVRNLRVSPGDRSIDVTWAPPEIGTATGYTARAYPGGRSCSTDELACTINGLKNGKGYRVTVTARSDAGPSAPVEAAKRVKPAGTPSAPRNVRARGIKGGLKIAWSKPLNNGGAPVRGYVATVWPGGRSCSTKKTSCRVRKLDPRSAYSVTVRARNRAGEGSISPGSIPVRPKAR